MKGFGFLKRNLQGQDIKVKLKKKSKSKTWFSVVIFCRNPHTGIKIKFAWQGQNFFNLRRSPTEIGQGGRKRNPRGVWKMFQIQNGLCSKCSVLNSELLSPTILEFRVTFSKFRTKDLSSKHNSGVPNRSLEFKTKAFSSSKYIQNS